ncbi:MAG: DUF3226 domain-containing protein [Flammeovirgaceae bacterium]
MAKRKKLPKQLLVEGKDDQHVIWALCEKFQLPQTFQVEDCGGIDNLFEQIPVRLKASDLNTLGIIIDADIDLIKRWQTITQQLLPTFSSLPTNLPKEGLVHQEDDKKVGVWIMPNNNLSGMLEDFIQFLVPDEDQLMPIVQQHIADIEARKLQKYKTTFHSKAEIHSWLALQEDPGTPFGLSITKRYLTVDKEQCQLFVNWLRQLFAA